jgi:hypothetical protein
MEIDPITLLATAIGSAKPIEHLLAPTLKYFGEGLKNWSERRVRNVTGILMAAAKTLGDRVENPGVIPPKVLKGILTEGEFCEDQLTAEYFGGVLAASLSGIIRDDRAAAIVSLIGRLPTYQIRTHYVFYRVVRDLFPDQQLYRPMIDLRPMNLHDTLDRGLARVFMPLPVYERAMEFDAAETEKLATLVPQTLFGLASEDLIDRQFVMGHSQDIGTEYPLAAGLNTEGIVYAPTTNGIFLYLWAHGYGDATAFDFLSSALPLVKDSRVTIEEGSIRVVLG